PKTLMSTELLQNLLKIPLGCAVCFGSAEDPMTKGLNWGIATLLMIIVIVLSLIAYSLFKFAQRSR
ncbi:MAG: hypothetical protein NUV91_08345, partial [Candidatus Omnitrophica bacterium]|nr:hypothetical protein [Candidatus Omnitrophota bacterium]